MNVLIIVLNFVICYLIGSIPSALIIGRLFRDIDIRNYGSGNLGATNAIRVLGVKLGLIVAIMDISKGGACILLATYAFTTDIPVIVFGLFVVLGHVFPIFAGFRGGKAVATSGGVLLFTSPIIFIIGLLTFYITLKITRYVSISSTVVAIVIFIATIIENLCFRDTFDFYFVGTIFIFLLFVVFRHIPNYKRLLKGNENKVGDNKNNKIKK